MHLANLNENLIYESNKAQLRQEVGVEDNAGEISRLGEHLQGVYFKMRLKAQGEVMQEMKSDMSIMKRILAMLVEESDNEELGAMVTRLRI